MENVENLTKMEKSILRAFARTQAKNISEHSKMILEKEDLKISSDPVASWEQ